MTMAVYVAKYDFHKERDNLLSFKKGDVFEVTDQSDSLWWAARAVDSNEIGYIPSSYVEVCSGQSPIDALHKENTGQFTHSPGKIRMDSLCELTNNMQRQTAPPGGYHPNYPVPDDIDNEVAPQSHSPAQTRKKIQQTLSASKEQKDLARDLKCTQQRGIQLGQPEFKKVYHNMQVKSAREQRQESELETKFKSISQKQEEEMRLKEEEKDKPEFLKVNLKKSKPPEVKS